jgi:manganese oxidase
MPGSPAGRGPTLPPDPDTDASPGEARPLSRRAFIGSATLAGLAASAAGAGLALRQGHSHEQVATPAAAAQPGGLATAHCVLNAATLAPDQAGLTDALLYPPPPQPAQQGRLRHFELTVRRQDVAVARDKTLHAWAFNGSVPGPLLRVTEGDTVEVVFHNRTTMPHTVHFHGIHPAAVDGVDPVVAPGADFTYRFTAKPFGLFVYHCHMAPLETHVNQGMYGVLVIDPPTPRPGAQELVMLMNGYDLQGKGDNQLYSVNGIAGYYARHPIPLDVGRPVRVYLANMTEFDPINSFHLHANVFAQVPSVRALQPLQWDDTVMLCQGQRAILEFEYASPGSYMFHAHQSEIAEKGWSGFFVVR